jgi:hypothetical protein
MARQVIGSSLQQIFESGKMVANGVFADSREGFFVLNVDSSEEIFDLFAPALDSLNLELHSVTTVDKVQEFFERDAAAGAGG